METNIRNKCKAYTSLEQSKKLAEILPLESADMCYLYDYDFDTLENIPTILEEEPKGHFMVFAKDIPCWSLAALLSVTRNYCTRFELILRTNKKYNLFAMGDNFVYRGFNEYPDGIDNPIDVCVDMIETLHEQKLL